MTEQETFSEGENEFLQAFVKILNHLHQRAIKAEREVLQMKRELEVRREQVELYEPPFGRTDTAKEK